MEGTVMCDMCGRRETSAICQRLQALLAQFRPGDRVRWAIWRRGPLGPEPAYEYGTVESITIGTEMETGDHMGAEDILRHSVVAIVRNRHGGRDHIPVEELERNPASEEFASPDLLTELHGKRKGGPYAYFNI